MGGIDLYVYLDGRDYPIGAAPKLVQDVHRTPIVEGRVLSSLDHFRKLARLLLPAVGYLPMSMLLPPGTKEETHQPKFHRYWMEADLIAGDMHYIHKYSPDDLTGKTVITNTTTPENIELLRARGVSKVITMMPRYEGRSFGTNVMEAALTAYAGKGRPLTEAELDALVDELDLRPSVEQLND